MKIIKTKFEGLFIYKKDTFLDNRGFFRELYLQKNIKQRFPFRVCTALGYFPCFYFKS